MNDSPDAANLHRATLDSYRAVAAASGTTVVHELRGWLLVDSTTGIDSLNHAYATGDVHPPSLNEAARWFAGRGAGYRLVLREPQDAATIAVALSAGFVLERRQPVMARALPLGEWPAPSEFSFKEVRDRPGVLRYLSVRADRPSHHPPGSTEAPFIHALVRSGKFRYFVASQNSEPVATASARGNGNVVIVSNVFVAPHLRRNGLGAAITAYAFASFGGRLAMLEASSMGEPLYQRMGFQTQYHHVQLRPPATQP